MSDVGSFIADMARRQRKGETFETPGISWITYAATISGSTGSAGTYAETVYRQRYYTLGHICHVQVSKQITNVGSWSGAFQALRPVIPVNMHNTLGDGKIFANGGLTSKANIANTNDWVFNWHSGWGVTALAWGGAGVVVNDWVFIDSIYEI